MKLKTLLVLLLLAGGLMQLGDVLIKVANNARLTPQEMDFLNRMGNETQMRNSFISGNTSADSKLKVDIPFFPIFSERLETNKTEVVIPIPTGYNHLMFFISAQNTNATSAGSIKVQINGDTGNNYNIQYTTFNLTTSYVATSATNYMNFGFSHSSESGAASSVIGYINNYSKPGRKMYISNSGVYIPLSSQQVSQAATSSWNSTDPINYIRIFSSVGDFVAGSIFTVYGIN